jgi:hypothetical protein
VWQIATPFFSSFAFVFFGENHLQKSNNIGITNNILSSSQIGKQNTHQELLCQVLSQYKDGNTLL